MHGVYAGNQLPFLSCIIPLWLGAYYVLLEGYAALYCRPLWWQAGRLPYVSLCSPTPPRTLSPILPAACSHW